MSDFMKTIINMEDKAYAVGYKSGWNAAIDEAVKIALAEANMFASGKYIATKIEGLKK